MDRRDKQLAEKVLGRLCVDGQIDGIRFGPVLQILITHINQPNHAPIKGQVYLNLGSGWKVFDSRPANFPDGEDELPELSNVEQIQAIINVRERTIAKVELAESEPHLILTLDDGRVLFVNGKHDAYECWNIGVAFSSDMWQVIACPGGDVAIWAPNNFGESGA